MLLGQCFHLKIIRKLVGIPSDNNENQRFSRYFALKKHRIFEKNTIFHDTQHHRSRCIIELSGVQRYRRRKNLHFAAKDVKKCPSSKKIWHFEKCLK